MHCASTSVDFFSKPWSQKGPISMPNFAVEDEGKNVNVLALVLAMET